MMVAIFAVLLGLRFYDLFDCFVRDLLPAAAP
jgi:hypothetical protein